jgi:hypothetical protein
MMGSQRKLGGTGNAWTEPSGPVYGSNSSAAGTLNSTGRGAATDRETGRHHRSPGSGKVPDSLAISKGKGPDGYDVGLKGAQASDDCSISNGKGFGGRTGIAWGVTLVSSSIIRLRAKTTPTT